MKIYDYSGRANISGDRIHQARTAQRLSQDVLAAKMQVYGVGLGREAISRIETGDRFVTLIRSHIGFGSSHCCRSARVRSPAGDAHNTGNSRPAVAVVLPLRVSRSISCGSSDISRSRAAPPPRKHFSLYSRSNPSLHLCYSSCGHCYIRGIDLTSHETAPHAFGHHACCAAARKWVKYNAALWAAC